MMGVRPDKYLFALSLTAIVALTGGCIYSSERTVEKSVPASPSAVIIPAVPERVVSYSEGRYQLYGDGRTVPYFWVWIPAGTTPPPPPVPPRLP
jgi:ABC-type Fe3+-hydroxamate transport system substrate-binding protein